ncbi:methylated-DNA--[protein]-cysteine S-methyltransferase [Clostridium neuense]|uniref:Methylated-DNA--protein-cysteine methyltransferase n=1 Tax=Clostridium neuense TaxID=1728934 RepID=A0ABW8TI53_9CLOT
MKFAYYESEIGLIKISADEDNVLGLDFVAEKDKEASESELLSETLKELHEYFKGKRKEFNLNLFLDGTDFQKKVWRELMKIPYGKVVTYGEVAKSIGNEKASRAVGNANNKNKIAIIIPCHRVIGVSGKLVGYAGGLWRKEWLLQHEKNAK